MPALLETLVFLSRVPSLASRGTLDQVSLKVSSLKAGASPLQLQSVYREMKSLAGPSSELLSLVFS